MRTQQTISQPSVIQGRGYWSGADVTVEFRPAPPHSGILFVRRDLPSLPRIPALVSYRIETPRRTTLAVRRATVEMVEHVLAALRGLRIDNCEVWVDRPEMPACDGSSAPFVQALLAAGISPQAEPAPRLVITELTRVGNEESWVEARPSDRPGLWLRYRLDYGSPSPIGRQSLQLAVTPESFSRELASARTFLLQEEAEWLRSRGLGQHVTSQDLLVFDQEGPVGNTLRFPDECVRHKTLDLVGDLALSGCDIEGQIVAYRSGHRLNAELVEVLRAEGQIQEGRRRSA